MGRLARLLERPRPRLSSLRTTFAVTFALVTAAVTILVGILSYNSAARLVRVDQQSVFTQVVQDVRNEVRRYDLAPADFASSRPGHELLRPSRTNVQVLGAGGEIVDR
ncbi:two-component sensor histidine kinase, partial [Streptomyces sp. NTH33]